MSQLQPGNRVLISGPRDPHRGKTGTVVAAVTFLALVRLDTCGPVSINLYGSGDLTPIHVTTAGTNP